MNIRFILNPVSGKKPADVAAIKEQIAAVFPGAQICLTQGPGHATTLAQEAAQNGVETVVAMGGDGTINEAAKGLVNTPSALGILPRGSGNGFARELGLMGSLPTALNKLKNASVRPCDAGFANGELFLNLAGVGIEAVIAWQFMEQAKTGSRGMWPYFKVAAQTLLSYRPQTLRITQENKTQTLAPLSLVFANGRQYGSHFIVAPHASLFDGQLDRVEIKDVCKLKLASVLPFFFLGKEPPLGTVQTVRTTHALIEADGEILYHIDGEPRKTQRCLEITVRPGALRLLVP